MSTEEWDSILETQTLSSSPNRKEVVSRLFKNGYITIEELIMLLGVEVKYIHTYLPSALYTSI